jgi:ABC-type glycerol-3-phosphate transport system substrate-binding protein
MNSIIYRMKRGVYRLKTKYNVILLLICTTLFLITGCQSKSEQIYKEYTDDPVNLIKNMAEDISSDSSDSDVLKVNENVSGDLVVYSRNPGIYTALDSWFTKDFNKEYPNVHVSFIGPDTKNGNDYSTNAAVALMSGNAGDIINLDSLPYTQYAQNDLLEDLYPYMANDPTFHREDYYTNIFEALEYNDKLYSIPLGFYYWCYRFNKTLLEESKIDISHLTTVNYKDITDIYQKVSLKRPDLILTKGWNQLIFEFNELVSYIDEKNDTASFNSKEYINYLNTLKRIPWPTETKETVFEDCQLSLENNELCGFFASTYVRARNALVFEDKKSKMTAPIPVSASNGEKPFQTAYFLGIPSASKNKELAWLFLSSWLKERSIGDMNENSTDSNYYIDGFSINRKNSIKLLEKAFGPGHEEDIAQIDLWNSKRNCTNMSSDKIDLLSVVGEISIEFFAGRITAEECAAQIQERVEIYLKE